MTKKMTTLPESTATVVAFPASPTPQPQPAANGGAPDQRPQIRVLAGELPRVVDEAEAALLRLDGDIYQRGALMVRPVLSKLTASHNRETTGWRLIPITRPHLVEVLTRAAQFVKYNGRLRDWVSIDAPDRVADAYLAREGSWRLPVLTGITSTPFLRGDGSICDRPGYDPASGLLFERGHVFPPIPPRPSRSDALAALADIGEIIKGFPFVTAADRAVALSAILTALDRRAMATAPLHAFTAPSAGTGKSLLVDIAAVLATGRLMPVISQGRSEEELEKRLGAALLAGDAAISFDNCEHTLQGVFLCQALTQPQVKIRLLGHSRNVEAPASASIFATGNNLTIAGDLTRRSLLCSLDAQCEHPERRSFDVDALALARAERPRLVAAALTVLRAWHTCGESVPRSPLGSFEQWSQRIRAPLLWLGCADPCETTLKVQASDPHLLALTSVATQWREHIGVQADKTVQETIDRAVNAPDFLVALLAVAANRHTSIVSNMRLGRWLKRVEGRVVSVGPAQLTLKNTGHERGAPLWALVPVPA
jgi:putative DNA primase/helicase